MWNHDRIHGLLAGAALGDALGAPHEFRHTQLPYTGRVEYRCRLLYRFQPQRLLEVGQVTDDTEMMLTLTRRLVTDTGYTRDAVLLDYLSWANSGCCMMGKNTRALFKGVTTVKGYSNRFRKQYELALDEVDDTTLPRDGWGQSNGALMRCAPLAVLRAPYDAVKRDCRLTNPHPTCVLTNMVYIQAIRFAASGMSNAELLARLVDLSQADSALHEVVVAAKLFHEGVDDGRTLCEDSSGGKRGKGWCLHGLYAALCALSFPTMSEALDWVIRDHPGSDTDTNACIAGALYGARVGYSGFDARARDNFAIVRQCTTLKGELPRDARYTLHDLDALVGGLEELSRR